MNKEGRFWFDLIKQCVILAILGLGVLFMLKKREYLGNLGPMAAIKYVVWPILILYIYIFIDTVRNMSSSYLFKPYDPTDEDSLKALAAVRQYRLFKGSGSYNGEALSLLLARSFMQEGFRERGRLSFGSVMEKGKGKSSERVIIIFKPMLNVIISDRHLKEASDFLLKEGRGVRRNSMIIVSDMESENEMLSSAVSVVNFLPKLSERSFLMPFILDLRHGRLFFPQDRSEQSLSDRHYFSQVKKFILNHGISGVKTEAR